MKSFLFIFTFLTATALADPITARDTCYPHGNLTDSTGTTFEFLHRQALNQIQIYAQERLRSRYEQAFSRAFATGRSMQNAAFTVAENIEDWLRNEPAGGILESMALREALTAYQDDVSQRLSTYPATSSDPTEQRVLDHTRYLEKSRATVAYYNLKNAMAAFTWSNGVQNTFAHASICPEGFFHISDSEAAHQGIIFEQWIQRDAVINSNDHSRVRNALLSQDSFEYLYSMRTNLPPTGQELIEFARRDLEQQSYSVEEDIPFSESSPDHESAEQRDHRIHRREYLERYLEFQSRHIPFKQFYINQCINGRGQIAAPAFTFHLNLNLRHEPRMTLSATASGHIQVGNYLFDVVLTDARHIDHLDPRVPASFGRFNSGTSNIAAEAIPPAELYETNGPLNMPAIEELWFRLHPQCIDRPLQTIAPPAPRLHGHHRSHGHHRRRPH